MMQNTEVGEIRMAVAHNLLATDLVVGEGSPPRARKPRRPTLSGALMQADKVGRTVERAEITQDGTIALTFGSTDEPIKEHNEWDEDHHEQTRTAEIRKIRG